MINAQTALKQLKAGNQRFIEHLEDSATLENHTKQVTLVKEQNPKAIILGCSDARVPAELVFDQSLGDLFVIRVAGNIVAPSQIGSVEFAAQAFGTRLVVVLGHTHCGAVNATLNVLTTPEKTASKSLQSIVDRISPSIVSLVEARGLSDRETLMRSCVRSNIRASVNQLRHSSSILEKMCEEDLLIIGAEYDIKTGKVEFFEQ